MDCNNAETCYDGLVPQIGCYNFNLLEGNTKNVLITFTKTEDQVTTDMNLTLFDSITMTVVNDKRTEDVVFIKTLGNGLQIIDGNKLQVSFGLETIGLVKNKLFYDIFFKGAGGNFHYLKGEIKIRPTISR